MQSERGIMEYKDAVERARVGLSKLDEVTNSEIIRAANGIYVVDAAMSKVDDLWNGDQYGRTGRKGVENLISQAIKYLGGF